MITNEQFEEAKNKYKDLISHTLIKYHRVTDYQELKQLANIALWKALMKFDCCKSSFSGYLFRMIRWELLSYHRNKQKLVTNIRVRKIKSRRNFEKTLFEIADCLNETEFKFFKSKFVDRKTLKEIAKEQDLHIDTVFERIKDIKDKIRNDLTY